MNLDSPNKALLWRCWRLSWKPAMIGQLVLYAILVPILLIGDFDDQDSLDGFIAASIFGYLIMIWAATLRMTLQSPHAWNSAGFHAPYDLRQPVSVNQLVLVPLAYMVMYYLLAYMIPALVFNWLFGYSGPTLLFCLIIVEAIIVVTAATWWSSDPWDSMIAWAVFIALYVSGWLFPDFLGSGLSEAGSMAVALNAGNVLHYVAINAGAILVTIAGVARQRHGENLLALSKSRLLNPQTGISQLATLGFLKGSCPTGSAWRAELWRLQRFRGVSNYALYGLAGALFPCLMFGAAALFSEDSEPVPMAPFFGASVLAFTIIVMSPAVSFYGLRTGNQQIQFALFDRIRPLPTTTLAAVNTLTLVMGLLAAAVSMSLFLNLFGPVFVGNFPELRQQLMELLAAWFQEPTGRWLPVLVLLPVYLLMVSILIATFISWTNLQPRRSTIIVMAIPCYTLLLAASLAGLDLHELLQLSVRNVWEIHLWFIAALLPAVGLYCFRELNRDRMLKAGQVIPILLAGLAILALVIYRVDTGWLDEIGFSTTLQFALVANLGLLPMISVGLVLFTMNRVLHQ